MGFPVLSQPEQVVLYNIYFVTRKKNKNSAAKKATQI